MPLILGAGSECTVLSSTLNTTTEVRPPQMAAHSSGCVFTLGVCMFVCVCVCICSLLTVVCVHMDGSI